MDNQNDSNNPPSNPEINPVPQPNPNADQALPVYAQPQQPVLTEQQMPQQPDPQAAPQAAPQTLQQEDPGRGFGIASLVTAILGMGLIAIILGIISIVKSKKANYPTNTLALVGIIWAVVSMILVTIFLVFLIIGNYRGVQTIGNDTLTKNDINSVYQKLEEYYNTNASYPSEFTAETFPGIDSNSLTDSNGDSFYFGDTTVKTLAEAESQSQPTADQLYQYLPYDCLNKNCLGYVVRGYLESGNLKTYTQYGLNNF